MSVSFSLSFPRTSLFTASPAIPTPWDHAAEPERTDTSCHGRSQGRRPWIPIDTFFAAIVPSGARPASGRTPAVQIREAEIYADEIYSAELKTSEAFGIYPIIEVDNFNADSLQLRLKVRLYTFGKLREGNVIFVDMSTRGGLPRSGQFTKNGISITGGEHHTIIPAPIATMMATLFSGG